MHTQTMKQKIPYMLFAMIMFCGMAVPAGAEGRGDSVMISPGVSGGSFRIAGESSLLTTFDLSLTRINRSLCRSTAVPRRTFSLWLAAESSMPAGW
jgi:hypothetical protein